MKRLVFPLLLGLLVWPLAACEREEGPAEELGESIDETREDVQEAVDDLNDDL
jgi:hypothetical protein